METNTYKDIVELPSKGCFAFATATNEAGEKVVLKWLKDKFKDKRQHVACLKREFSVGQKLDNPHIVKYFKLFEDAQRGWTIEREYVEGRSLADYIAERHPSSECVVILRQIAEALGYMHDHNIIYRNLTPSNVFITAQGDQVKLVDVRSLQADNLAVPSTSIKYMAPELRDGTMTVDGRSDIYSLGILMKDMGMDLEYSDVIEHCTRYGRSERFLDTEEYLDALDGGGSYHHHSRSSEGGGRPIFDLKKVLIAVIILVVVIGGAIAVKSMIDHGTFTSNSDTKDTVSMQKVEAPEKKAAPAPKPAANDFETQISQQVKTGVDAIFQPFFDWKNEGGTDQQIQKAMPKLNKKIKAFYLDLSSKQVNLSDSDRQVMDKVFGDYVNQKKAELTAPAQ